MGEMESEIDYRRYTNYQQKWNQPVLGMPENRLPRKALQYQPQGKIDLKIHYCRWKDQFM